MRRGLSASLRRCVVVERGSRAGWRGHSGSVSVFGVGGGRREVCDGMLTSLPYEVVRGLAVFVVEVWLNVKLEHRGVVNDASQ